MGRGKTRFLGGGILLGIEGVVFACSKLEKSGSKVDVDSPRRKKVVDFFFGLGLGDSTLNIHLRLPLGPGMEFSSSFALVKK